MKIVHLLLSLFATSLVVAADKPNFIVINIDDMGYADIGPFGSVTAAARHEADPSNHGCAISSKR